MSDRLFPSSITKSSGTPTDQQLDKINSRLDKPLNADEVFVFRSVASTRSVDSYFSRMSDRSLRNYAKDYSEYKPFLASHKTDQRATGVTFEADFDQERGELGVWTYTLRNLNLTGTNTNDFIRGVEGGLINDVSIHFYGGEDLCGICNDRLFSAKCNHLPGQNYDVDGQSVRAFYIVDQARASELSDVYKGSNPDSRIVRKAMQLYKRGVLDEKDVRAFNHRHSTNLRSYLEGKEHITFDFEDECDPGDVTTNAEGSVDHKEDPNYAYANPSEIVTGRGVIPSMTEEERKALSKYWSTYVVNNPDLDPESVTSIRTFIEALERNEDAEPPILKKMKKDAEKPGNTDGDDDEDDKPKRSRYYTAAEGMTFTRALRAIKFSPPSPSIMEPGKPDMAGMVMPGHDPLQNVASQAYTEVGEGETPEQSVGDSMGGETINNPTIEISPDGAVSFFFSGGSSSASDAGIAHQGGGLYVSGRGDTTEEVHYKPIRSDLTDVNEVRALVSLAVDGLRYKASLYRDMVRYGLLTHGDKFDMDFYCNRVAPSLSIADLAEMVEKMRMGVSEKFKTHDHITNIDIAEQVKSRQTTSGSIPALSKNGKDKESNDGRSDLSHYIS